MARDPVLEMHAEIEKGEHQLLVNRKANPGEKLCCVCNISTGLWVEITETPKKFIAYCDSDLDFLSATPALSEDVHCIPCFCASLEVKDARE